MINIIFVSLSYLKNNYNYTDWLSKEEIESARYKRRGYQSLYGKLGLKILLNRYGFDHNYSLSYSENCVAYAVSKEYNLGLDIEQVKQEKRNSRQARIASKWNANLTDDSLINFLFWFNKIEALAKLNTTGVFRQLKNGLEKNTPISLFVVNHKIEAWQNIYPTLKVTQTPRNHTPFFTVALAFKKLANHR